MRYRQQIPLSDNELIFGFLVLFTTVFLVSESRWSRLNNSSAISSDKPVHVYLDDPTNLTELSKILETSGLVHDKEEFFWAANIFGWRNFREGHYLVDRGFSYDEFLSKLARGIQDPVSVIILPGRTKGDIIESVSNTMQFDSLDLAQTIQDSSVLKDLDIESEDLIGRFYPNTYSIYWTNSPKSFLKRILEEFNNDVVNKFSERFDEIDKTVDEIVTLASIIEWEARREGEKSKISGLYWNRLDRGMRLQADPTINYVLGQRSRVLYEDYKIDHPYNTYLYRGLPPGPITNPSLRSIEAALYPEEHDFLYMVASPDGSHAFSKTFEEHKQNSAKWREWLREQYRIKSEQEN